MAIPLVRYLLIAFMLLHSGIKAQSKNDPAEYMAYIGDRYAELSLEFYKYMSTVAHARNGRKIEKKRQQLLNTSWDTYTKVRTMPTFKGDRTLRDTAAAYLRINHRVLKEDYEKILDLEDIANRSYDDMEAYMLAQKEARNKLDVANVRMLAEQKKFAAKHHLQLTFREDEIYYKMQEANLVLEYIGHVYLTFFRSHKQEIYLLEALSNRDTEGVMHNRDLLTAHSNSGNKRLRAIGDFQKDPILKEACIRLNDFYLDECSREVGLMLSYLQSEESFERVKTEFDQLSEEEKNNNAIQAYNSAVRELNEKAIQFNQANQQLHERRAKLTEEWRTAYELFLRNHMPLF